MQCLQSCREALRTEKSVLCVRLMSGSWCLEACSVYSPAGKIWEQRGVCCVCTADERVVVFRSMQCLQSCREALRTEKSVLCVRLMSGSWCLEACSVYSLAGKLWLMHTSREKLSSSSCCLMPFFVLEMWKVICSITVYDVALVSLAFLQPRERLESKAGKLALKKSETWARYS